MSALTDRIKEQVAEALFCAIWESDEAWELASNSQKATTYKWAQAAIEALQLTEEAERTSCTVPTCSWTYGCGHDGLRSRWVSRWTTAEGEQP